jgi:hypothetical protein
VQVPHRGKLREARNLDGAGSYLSSICTEEMEYLGVPKIRTLYEATYLAGLRKARIAGAVRSSIPAQ